MRILIIFALLGGFLTACSTPPPSAAKTSDPFAQLEQFTVTDLQNADAIAVANGDQIGHACYPALALFIQSLPGTNSTTTVSGAISAFETARVARMKIQGVVANGLPIYLKMGCSALVLDEQSLLIKLGALSAGAAAFAPAIPLVLGP